MATRERDRTSRRRAGSGQRDAKHRAGGDWTTLTLPDGIEIFSPKEGTVKMDIVPFEAGEGNPYAKPGEWYYERTFYTHGRVGPNNESYVCPSKTSKKPCPICEFRAKAAADPDGDEKLVKDLKPKERQLFLVRVHGKDGPEEKVRLYESSFHTFGKLLDKLRQEAEEDEPHKTDFDDPKKGAVLKVGYTDKDAGGYSFVDCYSIEFKPRPNGLDEDVLDHGICLDDVIKILSYDELKKAFLQEDKEADDDDEDKPAKSKPKGAKKKPKPEPEDDEPELTDEEPAFSVGQKVRHRQFGICVIKRITADGELVLTESDGTRHPGADPKNVRAVDEVPDEDDDEEEEEPEEDRQERIPPKSKKTVQKNMKDDWDKEADDDDEDKPAKSKPKDEEEDDWDKEEKSSKSKKTTKRAKDEGEDDWG